MVSLVKAVSAHSDSEGGGGHKNRMKSEKQCNRNFFPKKFSSNKKIVAVAEVAQVYHTV